MKKAKKRGKHDSGWTWGKDEVTLYCPCCAHTWNSKEAWPRCPNCLIEYRHYLYGERPTEGAARA